MAKDRALSQFAQRQNEKDLENVRLLQESQLKEHEIARLNREYLNQSKAITRLEDVGRHQ